MTKINYRERAHDLVDEVLDEGIAGKTVLDAIKEARMSDRNGKLYHRRCAWVWQIMMKCDHDFEGNSAYTPARTFDCNKCWITDLPLGGVSSLHMGNRARAVLMNSSRWPWPTMPDDFECPEDFEMTQ